MGRGGAGRGPRVLTQRRCSSKGSSVDSDRGASRVRVAPRGSWLTLLTSWRSTGGGAGWGMERREEETENRSLKNTSLLQLLTQIANNKK